MAQPQMACSCVETKASRFKIKEMFSEFRDDDWWSSRMSRTSGQENKQNLGSSALCNMGKRLRNSALAIGLRAYAKTTHTKMSESGLRVARVMYE